MCNAIATFIALAHQQYLEVAADQIGNPPLENQGDGDRYVQLSQRLAFVCCVHLITSRLCSLCICLHAFIFVRLIVARRCAAPSEGRRGSKESDRVASERLASVADHCPMPVPHFIYFVFRRK